MLFDNNQIIDEVVSKEALSTHEAQQLKMRLLNEDIVSVGDYTIIPDIHKVNENNLDLEKKIFLLNLEPMRQTSTRNYQLLLNSLKALGMKALVPEIIERIGSIDKRYTPSFILGDNWTNIETFFAVTNIVKQLTGDFNPRSFEMYGMFSGLDDETLRYIEIHETYRRKPRILNKFENILIALSNVNDVYGIAPIKNRVANYDFIFQHLKTVKNNGNNQVKEFETHYLSKYFENFRGNILWEHDWWVNGIWRGLAARKHKKFADIEIKYFVDTIENIIKQSFSYDEFKVERTDSAFGVTAINGIPALHDVILKKELVDCSASFITKRILSPFALKRYVYEPKLFEMSSFSREELKDGLDNGNLIKVSHADMIIRDSKGNIVINKGEMFGAPYSYTVLHYSNLGIKDPDLALFADLTKDRKTSYQEIFIKDKVEEANLRASLRGRFVDLCNALEAERAARKKTEEALYDSRRKSDIFQTYTRKSLVDRVDSGEDPRQEKPKNIETVILFSDIRGFTRLSESMNSEDMVKFLNSYFNRMNLPVIKYKGEFDKIIGDAIMAYFYDASCPKKSANDSVNVAIEMRLQLQEFNKQRFIYHEKHKHDASDFVRISSGIGLTYGPVTIANIGSSDKLDFTIIGDIVNVASRLESLTKYYKTGILISENLMDLLDYGFDTRFIDFIRLEGKDSPVKIYEVFNDEPENIRKIKLATKGSLSDAFFEYQNGKFEAAISIYEKVGREVGSHKYFPNLFVDPVLNFYIKRCISLEEQRKNGLINMASWNGVYEFKEK